MRKPGKACVIRLDPPKVAGERVRLDGHLEIPGRPDWDVHFEFTCPDPSQATIRARPFVLAFLPMAMRLGLPLRCDQPIDAVTYGNLRGWQTFHAAWNPARLRRVDLEIPVAEERRARTGAGAITAFSGGVDSCFTIARHAGKAAGDGLGHRLAAGLMIHGFDIPLKDGGDFSRAMDNTRRLLGHHGLAAHELRTDIRSRRGRPKLCWERETHGIWLAACLSCYEPWYDATVIPSSFAAAWSVAPFGSIFITDPLLGGASAPCINDGHAFKKPEKVMVIARDRFLTDHLRVCLSDKSLGGNCGRCPKCAATQISLELAGCDRPGAFPTRYQLDDIALTRFYGRNAGESTCDYLTHLRDEARRQGKHDIAEACEKAVRQFRRDAWVDDLAPAARRWVMRLLGGGK